MKQVPRGGPPYWRNETVAVHGGFDFDPATRAVAVPIYQTVAFAFDSAEHGAALFNLEAEGHRYGRISNPTTSVLEERVAALEGGIAAMCVSSGQAAIHYAMLNVASPGRNIVSVPQLYGTTFSMFAHLLPTMGITVRFAASDQPDAIASLIDQNTNAVYCESVGNPAGNVCDIEALAELAHRHGIPLIVDNTVATPILLRPIDHGADIVVHSLTKFMGGHGTTLGGVIVDSGKFPWARYPERFPMFNTPDLSYHGLVYAKRYGPAAYIARCRSVYLRTTGAVLSPLSSFLLLQGIETVALRIERHIENTRLVAEFLRDDPRVDWVSYVGFADHPSHALAQKYLGGRACSLFTFGVGGGFEASRTFYNALGLIKRLVNLGDAKTVACHPASTTHRQMSAEEQSHAGVAPEMIRLSIGIEHVDDIIADLDQALGTARPGSRVVDHSPAKTAAATDECARIRAPYTGRGEEPFGADDAGPLVIGFVNNMPDALFRTTEAQFRELVTAAAPPGVAVQLRSFLLPGIPRSDDAFRQPGSQYEDMRYAREDHLDGLIVSGTEPRNENLAAEPYWDAFADLIDWAESHTNSTIWSCLAAHAAVFYSDGIPRLRFPQKLSGVFDCASVADHKIFKGGPPTPVPHSRYNGLSEQALVQHGYGILSGGTDSGPDAFVKQHRSLFLFLQGHPEYDAGTLLREYRRDVRHFLAGRDKNYPNIPCNYLKTEAVEKLVAFRRRAVSDPTRTLFSNFPAISEDNLDCRWREGAVRLYSQWLTYLVDQRALQCHKVTRLRSREAMAQAMGRAE